MSSSASARCGFPAPHRAGLIEAEIPAGRSRPAARFRLLTEPASLKPGRRGSALARPGRFPAPHRAGLIEALGAHDGPPGPAGFRLLTEPASLKRLASPRPALPRQAVFPAPHRAGLIEASRWRAASISTPPSFRLLTEPASLKLPGWTCGPGRGGVSGSSQSRPH